MKSKLSGKKDWVKDSQVYLDEWVSLQFGEELGAQSQGQWSLVAMEEELVSDVVHVRLNNTAAQLCVCVSWGKWGPIPVMIPPEQLELEVVQELARNKSKGRVKSLAFAGLGEELAEVLKEEEQKAGAGGTKKPSLESEAISTLVLMYDMYKYAKVEDTGTSGPEILHHMMDTSKVAKKRYKITGVRLLIESEGDAIELLASASASQRAINWEGHGINVMHLGARSGDMRLIEGGLSGGCSLWEKEEKKKRMETEGFSPFNMAIINENYDTATQLLRLMLEDVFKGIKTEKELRIEVEMAQSLCRRNGLEVFSKDLEGLMESSLERKALMGVAMPKEKKSGEKSKGLVVRV